MHRIIIIPEDVHIQIEIPPDYIGKRLFVTIKLLEEESDHQPKKTMADFWGILSRKTGDELQESVRKSRDEWERDI